MVESDDITGADGNVARRKRWFLPLMAASGVTMSLTAPLEVLFARTFSYSAIYIGIFMLTSGVGVIVIDVFGTRFVPSLDAKYCLAAGLMLFGLACLGMGFAWNDTMLMTARAMQGFGGGLMLGAGLQAAVRVHPDANSAARALSRFNAAFLFGGAVGSPGGLLVAALVHGQLGYQIAFALSGTLALVISLALFFVLPSLAAPHGSPRPRVGLPQFDKTPGAIATLVLATIGDFIRGGVLFTALPLAGAARGLSTLTIGIAIALMSGIEILVLTISYRLLARLGVVLVLLAALTLGVLSASLLALLPGATIYLLISVLFGITLAGVTAGLPVLVIAMIGESSAGLAKFRISAGLGMLAGSVGCSVLCTTIGDSPLFALVAAVLLGSILVTRFVGNRLSATA
jgi:predicted MFS family arabinose efflux permease